MAKLLAAVEAERRTGGQERRAQAAVPAHRPAVYRSLREPAGVRPAAVG